METILDAPASGVSNYASLAIGIIFQYSDGYALMVDDMKIVEKTRTFGKITAHNTLQLLGTIPDKLDETILGPETIERLQFTKN